MATEAPRPELDLATLRAAVIGGDSPWRQVDVVPETGSTNADLLARAAQGADIAGAVLLAEHQTAGRGRHGRSWSAPPRSQLSCSVAVSAAGVPTEAWGWLPLLTGVAVVDALDQVCGLPAGLKWPNDVLAGDGKLAGILAEVASPGPTIVVGLGLNVTLTTEEAPDPRATSLLQLGHGDVDRTTLAAAWLAQLGARVTAWQAAGGPDAALRDDYRRYSLTLGAPVRALLPGGDEITGTATHVDELGRLGIDDGGAGATVSAGDITHLR
ncbi:biotin--[acetyl-CoA-carboxylase] ligase [Mycolicibacterium chitae]|uniref:Biotin--acetyl-CoA-carboxylase ligase n=1 Tax=Mycolicibacterium chitae TaxID=1792 RepID=A0A3S4SB91_MYCCI|nr:biotin--[acetyl-CoA-carboxylase] ligase [Mycolicibacterium chitae]MCV7105127.1 biotin--[acetyl-CoA-carboxylase] ligase [Mycolicibacterium chitae]BBZ05591.1 biotin--[acetyl-CoA-carboxylase] ligase [Mycolicibacterium chitae]VEG49204.1 biotin--acetyl-CoA-carboxylase ligase [Mycolicibacterium chitae]